MMKRRVPALIDPPIGFAHRGGRAHGRDNTLEAFKLAIAMGATGIETDAWQSADSQIVLVHDGRLPRVRGIGARGVLGRPISTVPADRIPSHVPTLDDYYEHCGTAVPLSVDVKDASAFNGLVAIARAHDAAQHLWLCHDDFDTLTRWRQDAPDVQLVHSTRLQRLPKGPERHAADLAAAEIDAVNLRRDDWTGGLTTLYHRFGVFTFGWDAQLSRHIAELINAGIDGVYSDHVDRLVDVVGRFETP